MIYNKSKSTQRFNFEVNRNSTAKKAGSNIVKISTRSSSDKYANGTSSLTMTVKEARALQGFLNDNLSPSSDTLSPSSDA